MNTTDTTPRIVRTRRGEDTDESRAATTGTEAGEISELARHRDPSQQTKAAGQKAAEKDRHGVVWVRPSELMTQATARAAGRGIDFQAELARRARRVPGQVYRGARTGVRAGTRAVSERARRLPPVSAFGRGGGERFTWISRSGIGLG
jgi:hypothetical protein